MRDRLRAAIEHWLPWYDPQAEARQRVVVRATIAGSVAARTRAVRAIHRAEETHVAYRLAADRLRR